jgi:subtilase family serine protease
MRGLADTFEEGLSMYQFRRSSFRHRSHLLLEELESRTLLSASTLDTLVASPQSSPKLDSQANVSVTPDGLGSGNGNNVTNPTPHGYTPSQVQNAYGFTQITFNNGAIKGDGSGQTIAIVDAYNDPNIKSDLNAFDSKFGLPAANLTVVNQNGGNQLPQTNSGWALEISLDLEWAHAMAPGARILLVEASNSSLSNLLSAVNYASQHASVVSMSWGSSEFSSETSYDSYFNKSGVTFVASSGDNGAPASWPSVSPNVVAVGGTTLKLNSSGGYGSETGWSGSGGGSSIYENEPSYQNSAQSSGVRTNPDVAYNANPNTGYAVFDTVSYSGQTGWFEVGGTSAGAPQVSALVAIANQGRTLAGKTALSGVSQTLPALYNMSSSDFHDITSGNNGSGAKSGYDLVTGRGSPIANSVVAALVSATSTGSVGDLVANTGSTSSSTTAKKADIVAGDPGPSFSSSGVVSLIIQPVATSEPVVLILPTHANTTSIFPFGTASVLSSAFGIGQSFSVPSGFAISQASAALSAVYGYQFLAPAPKSISSPPPENMGNYLSPFAQQSPDGVPLTGAEDADELGADGTPSPRRTLPLPLPSDIGFGLSPAFLSQKQAERALADDALFVDEASMAFLAEEGLAAANGENEGSWRLRVPTIALLGILASSFWMVPDVTEEHRKRRAILSVYPDSSVRAKR